MAIPPIGMCSAPCGAGLCGADIPGLSTPIAPLNNAAFYDGRIRAIALNADGTAQTLHPVDQEALFDLTNALGSIPNDPTRGLDIQAIMNASDANRLSTAIDRVNLCLAARILAGDVQINSVVLENPPVAGRVGLGVTYTNLRLPGPGGSQPQPAPTVHL